MIMPPNVPGRREWLPEELIIGQVVPGAAKSEVLDWPHEIEQRAGSFPRHGRHRTQPRAGAS
jgi:hypothetical protein